MSDSLQLRDVSGAMIDKDILYCAYRESCEEFFNN